LIELVLKNFRSYSKHRFVFESNKVALFGPNGVGKSNLLEAISLFSLGRGLRGAKSALLQSDYATDPWQLSMTLHQDYGPLELGLSYDPSIQRKLCRVQNVSVKSAQALSQWIRMFWLTPAMDRLWVESFSGRRRYFDRLIFTLFPEYAPFMATYEKALKERLHLLTTESETTQSNWLSSLEAIAAKAAIQVFQRRTVFLELLHQQFQKESGPFATPHIEMHGVFETEEPTGSSTEKEQRFQKNLQESRSLDQQKKSTRYGIHKTEFQIFHPNKKEAAFCSTGEQKSLLLSMTLAVSQLMQTQCAGMEHFLLLDDVLAHLDPQKRNYLMEKINGLSMNIFITGTEESLLQDFCGQRIAL
jgi:DNA replication and repair protein RecF